VAVELAGGETNQGQRVHLQRTRWDTFGLLGLNRSSPAREHVWRKRYKASPAVPPCGPAPLGGGCRVWNARETPRHHLPAGIVAEMDARARKRTRSFLNPTGLAPDSRSGTTKAAIL